MQPTSPTSPLVCLTLVAEAGGFRLREDTMIRDLNLHHHADDPSLLTALAVVSNSQRLVVPKQLSRLESLLIIWLSGDEWLALPDPDYGNNLEQALCDSFGPEIALEPIPDGTLQVQLPKAAREQLMDAENHPLNGSNHERPLRAGISICVRPHNAAVSWDLLLSEPDADLLQQWLTAPERRASI